MPWRPLPRIAFAIATYSFNTELEGELPLDIGDNLYIIEETLDGQWLRGYYLAPPSLLAGLTSVKGQTLEARVFSGIFPRTCVEIREVLGEAEEGVDKGAGYDGDDDALRSRSDSGKSGVTSSVKQQSQDVQDATEQIHSHHSSRASALAKTGETESRDRNTPKPAAPVPMLRMGDETPTSSNEPLIDEIASCLREWHSTNFHELLLTRQYGKLEQLSQVIQTVDVARRQFVHNLLTDREYIALREKTIWNLVKGNKLCGAEVIVRDFKERGRILTGDDSIVDITRSQSIMSLLDESPQSHIEPTALQHLLVDVKSFAGSSNEHTSLDLSLVNKSIGGNLTPLSETYTIDVPSGSAMGHVTNNPQMRTLFTDLTSADIGEGPSADSEFYLVVKVRAPQQIIMGKPVSRAGSYVQATTPFSKDKPPSASGNKSSRRSLMWGSTRAAFSRGGTKLDALPEQPEDRPRTDNHGKADATRPPGTASSKVGRISTDGSHQTHATADRMVGVGVLNLKSVIKQQGEESEAVVTVWSARPRSGSDHGDNDQGWDNLIRELLDSKSGRYEKSRRGERLQVHLRAFNHVDADALIKATPTVLSNVRKTSKVGFSGAPTRPRSDIYVTVNEAMLARQNLLSRFGGSATPLPNNLRASNLTISLEVRRQSGDLVDNCIFSSSNSDGATTWISFAAERGEKWNQTLRLTLLPPDVTTAHIVLKVSDLPNPPFAIAYMPLWDQRAFVSDGPHSLMLYRLDDFTQTAQPGPIGKGGYLSLPWSLRNDSSEVTGPLAALRIDTYLCSTRFSQDRIILGLLKWKEGAKDTIPSLLKQVIFVPEIEVVKLLSEVLDALFEILVEYQENDEYEDLVFTALVRVLGIVHDRRFNMSPLVDQYAENKFNCPFATPCLVRSFTRLLTRPTESDTARKLRATLKVVRHILKFITHARDQQKVKEAGIGITGNSPGFTRHLQSIFKALDAMMRSTAPVLVGSQTLAVQHFHTWLPELSSLLSTEEILHIAIDFMDSCALVKGKLVLYKLVLIINYSKLDLFSNSEQLSALCANTVRWIAPHWGGVDEVTEQWKDQVRLCCSVLASQVEHLNTEIPDYVPKIVESFLAIQATELKPKERLSLLFPTAYPFPTKPATGETVRFDEALIELSAVLSALSSSPNGMQLELAPEDLGVLLKSTLQVHTSILHGQAFPASWLSVYIYHHKSTMQTLQYLASILLESFLPHPDDAEDFDTELWKMFFATLLKLVGSPCLALETFPEQKRRAVWKIAGDVREHGAELLRKTWEAVGWDTSPDEKAKYGLSKMGGYQVQYVPALVGPIVELCLSVHGGLRNMAVEVLQTMIVSEWTLSEDLSVIQTEVIDSLDRFFKDQPMTESVLQKVFISELLQRFESVAKDDKDPLYPALKDFVGTIDELLELLVAVHSGDVNSEASHLINRLQLMEFLRDMQKEDIFIRYVHQLAALQSESRNHTEAGLALRLHADLYEWDPTKTKPCLREPELPEQSHFDRKERIYFGMIKHFEDGEAWTCALDAYNELRTQYEHNVFDFSKLARTERAIATIYETLAKGDKLVPKYFKVVFKGLGFPVTLRDKAFVYEGSPTERTTAFTDRMQAQYPAAQILTTGDVDSEVEGQYLVTSALSAHRDLGHQVFQRARVAPTIRDYLLSAHPQMFSVSSKRFTTGPVQGHYAEKIIYSTAEPFPTILRRSEILEIENVRLTAKETGLERIVRKTQEMTVVERRLADCQDTDDEAAQLLVDAISISVNPTSESSVARYRDLLSAPRLESIDHVAGSDRGEEELSPQDNAIKMALIDHAIMVKRCLTSFAHSTNPILVKGHKDLYPHFVTTFAPETAIFAPIPPSQEAGSTSSPTWHRSSPVSEHTVSRGNIPMSSTNGTAGVEEASAAQHISLKQRGTRLSFLGGKRKESVASQGEATTPRQGKVESDSNSQQSKSKDNSSNRRSIFLTQSNDTNVSSNPTGQPYSNGGSNSDRFAKNPEIVDVVGRDPEKSSESGMAKMGSVRKRLSMLKIGKKQSRPNGFIGGVSEE